MTIQIIFAILIVVMLALYGVLLVRTHLFHRRHRRHLQEQLQAQLGHPPIELPPPDPIDKDGRP